MEKEIKKLVELAKDYVQFGIEVQLPDGRHSNVRGCIEENPVFKRDGGVISIYFADDRETQSVSFGKVLVSDYNDTIRFPRDATPESLNEEYESAKEYLESHLIPNKIECLRFNTKDRENEIKELELKVKHLKESL